MKLVRYSILYIIGLLTIVLTACNGQSGDRPTIAVSIEPQRYLLEQIAGDRWEVVTLLDRGADPENFDPSMQTLKKASDAKAYFRMGHMAFEDNIIDRMSGEQKMTIVDTSKGIVPLTDTHNHDGHVHEFDPHVWSSVKSAKVIAANMYQALLDIDPEHAEYYTTNYNELAEKLEALDRELAETLLTSEGKAFLVWHPSLSYFARDYNLRQIALGSGDSKETSALEMKHNIEEARESGATVMFVQPEFDYRKSEDLARQTGTHTVTINPMSYNWDQEMRLTAKAIAGE